MTIGNNTRSPGKLLPPPMKAGGWEPQSDPFLGRSQDFNHGHAYSRKVAGWRIALRLFWWMEVVLVFLHYYGDIVFCSQYWSKLLLVIIYMFIHMWYEWYWRAWKNSTFLGSIVGMEFNVIPISVIRKCYESRREHDICLVLLLAQGLVITNSEQGFADKRGNVYGSIMPNIAGNYTFFFYPATLRNGENEGKINKELT